MMSVNTAQDYLELKEKFDKLGYEVIGVGYDKENDIIFIKEKK